MWLFSKSKIQMLEFFWFNGILLSYKNLRILQNVGSIRNDSSDIHFQVQADYFIFRPYVGATLKGVVNKKYLTHLGVLVHRVFNVVIPRPTEESDTEWEGTNIEEGQTVLFEIAALDLYGALPYIRGSLEKRWSELVEDDEDPGDSMKPLKLLDVSYVDFDKTKPVQRQMGDGLPGSSNKKLNSSIKGVNSTTNGINSATPIKSKAKKPNALVDTELRHSETISRLPKKHKKLDVV
ncbi:unnamed protein product [Leptidea sinapis]|uniref:RPA43 OB domain-containing protein n=1 Tax=Leptidea sinapis TaxID=189913 RepID=A0A5E4Q7I6_9NEOP|nr:unnamed protein product [Leptidea sinapis]